MEVGDAWVGVEGTEGVEGVSWNVGSEGAVNARAKRAVGRDGPARTMVRKKLAMVRGSRGDLVGRRMVKVWVKESWTLHLRRDFA